MERKLKREEATIIKICPRVFMIIVIHAILYVDDMLFIYIHLFMKLYLLPILGTHVGRPVLINVDWIYISECKSSHTVPHVLEIDRSVIIIVCGCRIIIQTGYCVFDILKVLI